MPGQAEVTNAIFSIDKSNVPTARFMDVTYVRVVVNYRPDNTATYCTLLTVGDDQLNYLGDCGTPTVNLLIVNLLLNSVVSNTGSKFMTINIKYLYLNTPMPWYKYMHLKLRNHPHGF